MQTFGANTHEIPLCKSLSMRCSVSISRSSEKYKKTKGFYNNAHFSFYSRDLKKKIGKEWRTTYPPTKKAMRSSAGEKPQAQLPGNQVIQNALQNLLCINSGISLTHCKTTKTGEKTVTLDNDELLIFWLTRYREIAKLDTSVRTDVDRQKAFAKLCPFISGFRLSSLCSSVTNDLFSACGQLAAGIKAALNLDAETSTSNTNQKAKIVRFAIELYLKEQGINPSAALERIIKQSNGPFPQPERTDQLRRLILPQTTPAALWSVTPDQIDSNGHLNNVHYIRHAEALAPAGCTGLEIMFDRECFAGETLRLESTDCGSFFVRGVKENGEESFRARFWKEDSQ